MPDFRSEPLISIGMLLTTLSLADRMRTDSFGSGKEFLIRQPTISFSSLRVKEGAHSLSNSKSGRAWLEPVKMVKAETEEFLSLFAS